MYKLCTVLYYLKDPDHDDRLGIEEGSGGDQEVEAGGEEDGGPEEAVGGVLGGEEPAGQLGHDVAPEERGVHVANGLRTPVELRDVLPLLVGLVRHHGDLRHTHVAADPEGDDEPSHNQDSLNRKKI